MNDKGLLKAILKNNNKKMLIVFLIGLLSISYVYQIYSSNPLPISMQQALQSVENKASSETKTFTGFSCQSKRHCGQMNSCDEAKFSLKHCPNVKIDWDGDGIPCELLLCRNIKFTD
jgi:predicted negative regulator of RcsB-dependent stress response